MLKQITELSDVAKYVGRGFYQIAYNQKRHLLPETYTFNVNETVNWNTEKAKKLNILITQYNDNLEQSSDLYLVDFAVDVERAISVEYDLNAEQAKTVYSMALTSGEKKGKLEIINYAHLFASFAQKIAVAEKN